MHSTIHRTVQIQRCTHVSKQIANALKFAYFKGAALFLLKSNQSTPHMMNAHIQNKCHSLLTI